MYSMCFLYHAVCAHEERRDHVLGKLNDNEAQLGRNIIHKITSTRLSNTQPLDEGSRRIRWIGVEPNRDD